DLLSGRTVFLLDGQQKALAIGTEGWEMRGIEEPVTQTVIRGPRESFTETLLTNTALIRRKIKSPNLWMESMTIGEQTKTFVSIMYMHGIVDPKIVEEVRERLDRINIDGVFDSG